MRQSLSMVSKKMFRFIDYGQHVMSHKLVVQQDQEDQPSKINTGSGSFDFGAGGFTSSSLQSVHVSVPAVEASSSSEVEPVERVPPEKMDEAT